MDDQRADEAAPILDDDPPASVRVAFIWLTASAGVMLLLPRQVVSAGICFALSAGTLGVHLVLRRRNKHPSPPSRSEGRRGGEGAASTSSSTTTVLPREKATEPQEEETAAPPEPPASSG